MGLWELHWTQQATITLLMLAFSSSYFLCFQMEMIPEPDPDDEGTKISVSWRTCHVSLVVAQCFSNMCRHDASWQHFIPSKHNSSWFPRIVHLQPEKRANQWNQWQCIITVRVVPFRGSCLRNRSAPFLLSVSVCILCSVHHAVFLQMTSLESSDR